MRSDIKHRWKKSVLIQYITSYICIVLICCVVLISFSSFFTARRLNEEMLQHQRYQLELAAGSIEARYREMEEVAYDIAISADFKPTLFMRNPYYEISILSGLNKYTGRTMLDAGFFLTYNGSDAIYTKTSKYYSQIYFQTQLNSENPRLLKERIDSIKSFSILTEGDFSPGFHLWCYPIRILGEPFSHNKATLVYIIPESAYRTEFERVVGELPGDIQLCFNGEVISEIDAGVAADAGNAFTASNKDGVFELTMQPSLRDDYAGTLHDSKYNIILAAIVLAMLVFGVLIAVRNYNPIRRVYNKQQHIQHTSRNELDALELTLDRYAEETENYTQLVTDQLWMIRSQSLQLLLGGQTLSNEVLHELGISLPHSWYFVVTFIPLHGSAVTRDEIMKLPQGDIDPDYAQYITLSDNQSLVEVMINASGPDLCKTAVAALVENCKSIGLRAAFGVSSCINGKEKLRLCVIEALSAMNAVGDSNIAFYDEISTGINGHLSQLSDFDALDAHLHSGNQTQLQEYLKHLVLSIKDATPSIPVQLYYCNRIINELVRYAQKLGVNLKPEQISWMCTSTSVDSLLEGMIEIVYEILDVQSKQENSADDSFAQSIVSFVDEYYLDYAMSLDLLADKFSMSASQISRLFKNTTNEAFKDYIVRKRIKKAQELIQTENIPVSELCTRVGYTNVSHFIKIFKSQLGVTPAAYRNAIHGG